jgi:hypothetical protein
MNKIIFTTLLKKLIQELTEVILDYKSKKYFLKFSK